MTEADLKKLKSYYGTLRNQMRQLDFAAEQQNHFTIADSQFTMIMTEVENLRRDFPGLVPPVDPRTLGERVGGGTRYYNLQGLRLHLGSVIARIETEMESDAAPVIEPRTFPFVTDAKLRAIVERDFAEAQKAWLSGCRKSVIILSGGLVEAILL